MSKLAVFRVTLGLLTLTYSARLFAHPMGNFSVSHYAKLVVTVHGIDVQYALDLAEIPTFELLRGWNLDRSSSRSELDKRAGAQAREWLKNLVIAIDGKPVQARFEHAVLTISDGAGNLPILRITTQAHIDAPRASFEHGPSLAYEDRNFPERAGWKEIVVDASVGAILRRASQTNKDISKVLTQYPPDPTIAPPQDLRAQVEWTASKPSVIAKTHQRVNDSPPSGKGTLQPVIAPIPQPKSPRATSPALMTAQAAPRGAVVRGDFLSKLLHQRELTAWMVLVALAFAFALGAAHALTPGHGKTIMAAYLVGSKGTLKHAAFLGGMVTFTHTITVFALGLAVLFLFRYIVPEKIAQTLGVASGLCIVAVGAWMFRKRILSRARPDAHHSHDHPHRHDHDHAHTHHGVHHVHAGESHGHVHSHVPDKISWGGLVVLGASGGLVPCESALVLLLGAIALGRVALGLLLLLSFSLGLALVLVAIGVLVLYAKNLIPERKRTGSHPIFQWISIISPAIVTIVGLLMTGVSLGWIQPQWAFG